MAAPENLDHLSPAKRALYEIRALRSRVQELEQQRAEPIAIVGIGLRFPGGASTPQDFWDVMANGVDTVTEIPASRWSIDRYYDGNPDAPGKMCTRSGAFLDAPGLFDAPFFGISPREATVLDPQHRLALEVAWEALENAGCNPAGLAGTAAGVFLAMSNSDYARLIFGRVNELDAYASTGNIFSVAAGRISFTLGLEGPSMAIDTACSGSLVAVHLACQSLRSGESSLALAGGVNLILTPEISVNFSKSRMMAPDGKCKTFDAAADGYVRGEGCGIVVLKRLSDALAQRDRILALIRGSAINQDGRSSGLTAPNGSAQQAVIRQALAAAAVQPHEIGYIEAHGTGTSLGDPIEAHALAAVLSSGRDSSHPLLLGSVKTNIGHLESAAGVAGLIKTILALQHAEIPPHLHFQQLNPHIDWAGLPVEIPVHSKPWPRSERKRFAGVSSFGFSGTNSHVIVEEAPLPSPVERPFERPLHLLTLSARTPQALATLAQRYAAKLDSADDDLADICFTANAGRAQLEERSCYLSASRADMTEALRRDPAGRGRKESNQIAFLFPGQGAQFPGMGRELYDTHPEFRRALEECAELLRPEFPEPLLEVLWGAHTPLLEQTRYTQPALFALEYALAQLWRSWGIEPSAVLGHSVGEYAAACFAGVYSLADGLKLIAGRARLMQAVRGRGAMTAVSAREAIVNEALAGLAPQARIAALNAPESIVISGYVEAIEQAEARLREAGVRTQRLAVSHAFHSPQMAEMEQAFVELVKTIRFEAPRVELISSVTGQPVSAAEMSDPGYWRRQVSEPVRFAAAMQSLADKHYGVYVEAGPGSTLCGLGKQTVTSSEILWTPSLRQSRGAWQQMVESLGQLWVRGAEVDWAAFDRPYHRRKVALPTYPFERQRYWVEERPSSAPADENAAWQSICEHAAEEAARGRLDLHLSEYPRRWAALDRLVSASIAAAWQALGIFQTAGEQHTVGSLLRHAGIRPVLHKLMGRWLEQFAAEGLLRQDGERFTAPRPLAAPPLEPLAAAVRDAFTSDRAIAEYAIECSHKLAALLTGAESPLSVLFPSGSLARAEEVYEQAAFSAYFAAIVRGALDGLLRYRTERCSVVEIGAGTGGTTSALLPLLPPDAVYHFTDVSAAFLSHAERKFAAWPQVRYGLLDIERDPAGQGYPAGSCDVVIATNVLHATRDIQETLRNVYALLAPAGVLLLCEATTNLSWLDITVGLTEGWHRSDDGLRGGKPLLAREQWEPLLLESGFERVASYPAPGTLPDIFGQHVFAARKTGARGIPAAAADTQTATAVSDQAAAELNELRSVHPAQRHELLVTLLRREIAALLRFASPEQIDRKRRLTDLGLDSLMSLELRNRLTVALHPESPLSATLVFDCPTLDALAEHLNQAVFGFEPEDGPADITNEALRAEAERLEELDDDEVAALLVQKLQTL